MFTDTLQRWLNRLTQPHTTLTTIEDRRRSRLLAALMLTVATLSLLVSILLLFRNDGTIRPTVYTVWIGVALTAALYMLNRRGHYQQSAYGFVALNFALLHAAPLFTQDVTWLLFGTMLMVMSVILLPVRAAAIIFGLSIAVQIVFGALLDFEANITYITTFTTANVFVLTSALLLVYVRHRAGIEHERREELRAANRQLRDSELALERRVEERTRELQIAKEEAEAARLRAEQADKIKTQFLASMSHELRTPLNAILNFTEFVELEMFGPLNEQQKDALGKSLDSGRHLLSLINDVLDITKIEAGMMKLFVEPSVDVTGLLPTVLKTAALLLEKTDVELIADIDSSLPIIEGDSRRVRQVLLNLLSNACKYTTRGTITLSAKNRGDHLLFCVSDTGIGIASADQERIFQPFQQTERGRGHSEGTGLGLAISQWIVHAHGGKLWVESTPGEGSSFYFTLPIKQPVVMNEMSVA